MGVGIWPGLQAPIFQLSVFQIVLQVAREFANAEEDASMWDAIVELGLEEDVKDPAGEGFPPMAGTNANVRFQFSWTGNILCVLLHSSLAVATQMVDLVEFWYGDPLDNISAKSLTEGFRYAKNRPQELFLVHGYVGILNG